MRGWGLTLPLLGWVVQPARGLECVEPQRDFGMPLAGGRGAGGCHWCAASRGLTAAGTQGKLSSAFAGEGQSTSEPVPSTACVLLPLGRTSSARWRGSEGPFPPGTALGLLRTPVCAPSGLGDRRAGTGGMACCRVCSHSYLWDGPALPRGRGRWLCICRTGCELAPALPDIPRRAWLLLLPVPARFGGGQGAWGWARVWVLGLGWGEPVARLLCMMVAASAPAETRGGLGGPSTLWQPGWVGSGAVPPLCSPWPLTFASP